MVCHNRLDRNLPKEGNAGYHHYFIFSPVWPQTHVYYFTIDSVSKIIEVTPSNFFFCSGSNEVVGNISERHTYGYSKKCIGLSKKALQALQNEEYHNLIFFTMIEYVDINSCLWPYRNFCMHENYCR